MLTLWAKVHVSAFPARSILTSHEIPPSTGSDAPPRQPSLILFSLDEMHALVSLSAIVLISASLGVVVGIVFRGRLRFAAAVSFVLGAGVFVFVEWFFGGSIVWLWRQPIQTMLEQWPGLLFTLFPVFLSSVAACLVCERNGH